MLKQLEDKDAEVRVTLLNASEEVIRATGAQVFGDRLTHAVLMLSEEQDWRVRKGTLLAVPLLARSMTSAQFDERLKPLVSGYLNDAVNYVRRVCAQTVVEIGRIYGVQWALARIPPLVDELFAKTNYLQRVNAAFLCHEAGAAFPELREALVERLVRMTGDPVANVRFMAAEVLGDFAGFGFPGVGARDKARAAVAELARDADGDVRSFAADALAKF